MEDHIKEGKLTIYVKANANKTCIKEYDEARKALRVEVAAPPQDNKANIEIIKFFSRLTGKQVRILRGATSKKKVLQLY